MVKRSNAGVLFPPEIRDGACLVGAAIIKYKDFPVREVIGEQVDEKRKRGANISFFIEGGDDDADRMLCHAQILHRPRPKFLTLLSCRQYFVRIIRVFDEV